MHSLCQPPPPPPDLTKLSTASSSYRQRKINIVALMLLVAGLACLAFGQVCLATQLSTLNPQPFGCLALGQICNASVSSPTSLRQVHQPSTISNQPILSQLPPPDPAHFTNWLLSATAALSILALGKQFVRKTPLETQFLTRKEFAEFREKLDVDLSAIGAKIDRSHDLLSHRLDVLSVRMDEVRSLVDRVDERTKHPERIRRSINHP